MKTFLTLLVINLTLKAYGQTARSEYGIHVFEQVDSLVTDTYFIPALTEGFPDLVSRNDTIKAFYVAFFTGGCLDNSQWLRDTMAKAKVLASYQVEVHQMNHQNLEFSDRRWLYTSLGTITYLPNQGYMLRKQYKTITLHNKKVVIEIAFFQPFIEMKTVKSGLVFN